MHASDKGKVSVIIPAYNSADTLVQCVNSVLMQDYGNLDILLVNDGSTDGTLSVMGFFEALDKRVRVLNNRVNAGCAYARNMCLDVIHGDYVLFVDADDYLYSDMIASCVDAIGSCDMLVSGMRVRTPSMDRPRVPYDDGIFTGRDIWEYVVLDRYLSGTAGGKFYKASVIKELRFNDGVFFQEDLDFNLRVLERVSCLRLFQYVGYVYMKFSKKTPNPVANLKNEVSLYRLASKAGVSGDNLKMLASDIATFVYTAVYHSESFESAKNMCCSFLNDTDILSMKPVFTDKSIAHAQFVEHILEGHADGDIRSVRRRAFVSGIVHGRKADDDISFDGCVQL